MDIKIDNNCEWNADSETLTFSVQIDDKLISLIVPFELLLENPPVPVSGLSAGGNYNGCNKQEVLQDYCLNNMGFLEQALAKKIHVTKITESQAVTLLHW